MTVGYLPGVGDVVKVPPEVAVLGDGRVVWVVTCDMKCVYISLNPAVVVFSKMQPCRA